VADLFGTDLSCVTDLTSDCAEVAGVTGWLQSLCRRLQGTLFYDPDYGYDLVDMLDDEVKISDLDAVGADIDTEFLKDERTLSSSTDVVKSVTNGAVVSLKVTSRVRSALGPFTLTLGVDNVTVTILSITPG
jgi:hypothetical protein